MHFSPFALARPLFLAITGLTALAVAVGRATPDVSETRRFEPVRYHGINWFHFQKPSGSPLFLDANTGEVSHSALPETDRLEYLSCSPWRDADGQRQVVGLWDDATSLKEGGIGRGLGLARYTYPEGRVCDRIPLERVPVCAPCWYPGTASRLLFAAPDGILYRFSFEEGRKDKDPLRDDFRHPRPLKWRIDRPANGRFLIRDPFWSIDPALKGRLLVSMIFMEGAGVPPVNDEGTRLWWLELNPQRTEIIGAGRLPVTGPENRERWPVLARSPQGRLTLAYLVRQDGSVGWMLRLAELESTDDPMNPFRLRPIPLTQTEPGADGPPVFSTDGRWVNIIAKREGGPTWIEQFALDGDRSVSGQRPILSASVHTD